MDEPPKTPRVAPDAGIAAAVEHLGDLIERDPQLADHYQRVR